MTHALRSRIIQGALTFLFIFSACAPATTFAQTVPQTTDPNVTRPTPRTSNEGTRSRYGLYEPLGGITIPVLLGRFVRFVTGVVGAIFLLSFMYGGFMWMTASGSTEKIEKAQKILSNALIGIVIVVASYLLVSVTFDLFNTVQGTQTQAPPSQTPTQQQADQQTAPAPYDTTGYGGIPLTP